MELSSLLSAQRAFFHSGQTRPLSARMALLTKLRDVLKQNENSLHAALFADFGKSAYESHVNDLGMVYKEIHSALKNLRRWAKPRRVPTDWVNWPGKSVIISEPLGCVLVIGAWNYPLQLALGPAVAALAAGNTVVLKPSELPARTSAELARIIGSAFQPAQFAVVEGGVEVTTQLLAEKFAKIFFTGSPAVGCIVYQAAAKQLTPVTLELGGKSPAWVAADANIAMCAKRLVWAKFLNAGQTCVAPDYVLVHRSIAEALVQAMQSEIERSQYKIEHGNYMHIVNERHFDRLLGLMADCPIRFGGKANRNTLTIEPTLLYPATAQSLAMQSEIFGPLLPIIPFDSDHEARQIIAEHSHPLAFYLFTESLQLQNEILSNIPFGGGMVNDALMHLVNEHLPFGGVGNSGMGAYHGEFGFKTFSHQKSVVIRSTWFEAPLKYFPYKAWKLKIMQWALGNR